jgi:3-phosphoshikimate 1-carboxyvinyltransferase
MLLEVKKSTLSGSIRVAGSFAHTIRGIIFASLSQGTSTLISPLDTCETNALLDAIKALGAKVEKSNNYWKISKIERKEDNSNNNSLTLSNFSNNLEYLCALASLQDRAFTINNIKNINTLLPLLNNLASLGATFSYNETKLTICGPLKGGSIKVDGKNAKNLNALLLVLPFALGNTAITLDYLNEQPQVATSLDWLDFLGVKYKGSRNLLHWEIPGNQCVNAFTKIIPANFLMAIYPLVAATIAGNGVEICNLDFSDLQNEKRVFSMVERMGAKIHWVDLLTTPLKVDAPIKLNEVILDISSTPDALPILAVACLFLPNISKLINVPQARLKKLDYISTMAKLLTQLGGKVEELPDGLVIYGGQRLHGNRIFCYKDGLIAMALAVAALALNENEVIQIEDAQCIKEYYPTFIEDLKFLGANFKVLE